MKILLDNFRKSKNLALLRRNDKWKENLKAFARICFDNFGEGKTEREALEKLYGVEMHNHENSKN